VCGGHFMVMALGRSDTTYTIPNGLNWAEAEPDRIIADKAAGCCGFCCAVSVSLCRVAMEGNSRKAVMTVPLILSLFRLI
jgi:hypothetical protein